MWKCSIEYFVKTDLGTLVSVTNKTDCHDITEILLIVTLNGTKTLTSINRQRSF